MFTDPQLQELIRAVLANNTDMLSAHLRVEEAKATLFFGSVGLSPDVQFCAAGGHQQFR